MLEQKNELTTTGDESPFTKKSITECIATLPAALSAKHIHLMGKEALLKVQRHMQLGATWGVMQIPKNWLSKNAGSKSRTSFHVFRKVARDDDELDLAILTAVRMFLIMLIVPSQTTPRKPAQILAPTSVASSMQGYLNPLIREALTKPAREDGKLLARVDRHVFPGNDRYSNFKPHYVRFDQYTESGYWDDPVSDSLPHSTAEQSNRGVKRTRKEKAKNAYKPLPDDLVHAVGRAASWIVLNLSEATLQIYEAVLTTRVGTREQRERRAKQMLKRSEWIDKDGRPLRPPPELSAVALPPTTYLELLDLVDLCQKSHFFVIALSAGPRAGEILSFSTSSLVETRDGMPLARGRTFKIVDPVAGAMRDWPLPALAAEALRQQIRLSKSITAALQGSFYRDRDDRELVPVNWPAIQVRLNQLGKSIRWLGENIHSTSACYNWRKGRKGRIRYVSKAADVLGLEPREIVMDEESALAINARRQSQLVVATTEREEALWRQTDHKIHFGATWTSGYNKEMREFVQTLGLSRLLDRQPLTLHRYRKTIARLVALCYAHAPKILMDIFGHSDIDMTLHYILEDSTLLVEIEYVRKEIMLMKAEKAVREISAYGGPAQKKIVAAIEGIRTATGDFNAKDAEELAAKLTVDGRYWQMVRPGVICTKLQDEVGPCNKGRSTPNPASCSSGCSHRLEEAELRAEVDMLIGELVKYLEKAWAQGDNLLATMWVGQIMSQIHRFDDVRAKWDLHPTVQQVLKLSRSTEEAYA